MKHSQSYAVRIHNGSGFGFPSTVEVLSAERAERPHNPAPQCVVVDDFLGPVELWGLGADLQMRRREFVPSRVGGGEDVTGAVSPWHRRSRVLYDLGPWRAVILRRVLVALPRILACLHVPRFHAADVEIQATSTGDAEYFRAHMDNGGKLQRRVVSYTLFVHQEPKRFGGGELRIYRQRGGVAIVPRRNRAAFFPSGLWHEITPVKCSSPAFQDSRLTVNGWILK